MHTTTREWGLYSSPFDRRGNRHRELKTLAWVTQPRKSELVSNFDPKARLWGSRIGVRSWSGSGFALPCGGRARGCQGHGVLGDLVLAALEPSRD